MTIETRHVMMQRDAIADPKAPDPRAKAYDGSGGFMPKHSRRGDGAILNFLDVGGADAAGGDFDQQFVAPDAGHRQGLEPQIIDAAINDSAHRAGNFGGHDVEDKRNGR